MPLFGSTKKSPVDIVKALQHDIKLLALGREPSGKKTDKVCWISIIFIKTHWISLNSTSS